jgi:hypothetical protein
VLIVDAPRLAKQDEVAAKLAEELQRKVDRSTALIFSSEIDIVAEMATECLILDGGVAFGPYPTNEAVERYLELVEGGHHTSPDLFTPVSKIKSLLQRTRRNDLANNDKQSEVVVPPEIAVQAKSLGGGVVFGAPDESEHQQSDSRIRLASERRAAKQSFAPLATLRRTSVNEEEYCRERVTLVFFGHTVVQLEIELHVSRHCMIAQLSIAIHSVFGDEVAVSWIDFQSQEFNHGDAIILTASLAVPKLPPGVYGVSVTPNEVGSVFGDLRNRQKVLKFGVPGVSCESEPRFEIVRHSVEKKGR